MSRAVRRLDSSVLLSRQRMRVGRASVVADGAVRWYVVRAHSSPRY